MKNLIKIIAVLLIAFTANTLHAQTETATKKSSFSVNVGAGNFLFTENYFYADINNVYEITDRISIDTKLAFKGFGEGTNYLSLYSGARWYAIDKSASVRPYMNFMIGGGVIQDSYSSLFSESSERSADYHFAPDYSVGFGVELKEHFNMGMSLESLGIVARVGYKF